MDQVLQRVSGNRKLDGMLCKVADPARARGEGFIAAVLIPIYVALAEQNRVSSTVWTVITALRA